MSQHLWQFSIHKGNLKDALATVVAFFPRFLQEEWCQASSRRIYIIHKQIKMTFNNMNSFFLHSNNYLVRASCGHYHFLIYILSIYDHNYSRKNIYAYLYGHAQFSIFELAAHNYLLQVQPWKIFLS